MTSAELVADLKKHATRTPEDVKRLMGFFKTAQGQYGAGDTFIGIRVPQVRAVCKNYSRLSLGEIEKTLESAIHEARLAAVIIMADQAKKADAERKKALFDLYLRRTDRINNWDIVDSSCREVVGEYLLDKSRTVLYELAKSKDLWERRIAMVSTYAFICHGETAETYKIAEMLMQDKHDLIHKAVGWMLRETGKRVSKDSLRDFLNKHAATMPRTTLRYAIEHFDPATREHYLKMKLLQ